MLNVNQKSLRNDILKVYIASSWRNKYQPMVVEAIKNIGVDVYDFRHPEDGDIGFHWSEIDKNWQNWTPQEYVKKLKHPIAENGYNKDIYALNQCNVAVLVLPCGRSAHLEFGYNVGMCKKGAILILESCEPELMYRMATKVFTDLDDLVFWIERESKEVS